ncbi:hypothetical protein [Nonomuraea cavernae]|uniref:hypothetical protein n=1 Tax=Nonomuraea cavernae TaxID=2045107 RepID=UPI0033C4D69E
MRADLVERLLGVPPGYPSWRVADLAGRAGILPTWLSTASLRGVELSPAARSQLDRVRDRVLELHRVGAEQADAHGLTIIKGPRIARYFPPGVLRQSGDVDLVAPDEESLWDCVLDLAGRYGAVAQGVSVLSGPLDMQVCVTMKWPAAEPHLDRPLGADVSTVAFAGDLTSVPCRAEAPPEDDLCGLFAVAEERFQRRFRVKDLLDFLVLSDVVEERLGDATADVVGARADALCLAPELRALVRKAARRVTLSSCWQKVLDELGSLAALEKRRRRAGRPGVPRLRYGFPLDTVPYERRRVEVHRSHDFDLAATPLGTCLLVDDPVIAEERLREAVDRAGRIATRERR